MSESADMLVANAKYKQYLTTPDGGFWLICNRPFEEAATDMLRSAIRACKPVPSVLGSKRIAFTQLV